jgi:hypothetical protein
MCSFSGCDVVTEAPALGYWGNPKQNPESPDSVDVTPFRFLTEMLFLYMRTGQFYRRHSLTQY